MKKPFSSSRPLSDAKVSSKLFMQKIKYWLTDFRRVVFTSRGRQSPTISLPKTASITISEMTVSGYDCAESRY